MDEKEAWKNSGLENRGNFSESAVDELHKDIEVLADLLIEYKGKMDHANRFVPRGEEIDLEAAERERDDAEEARQKVVKNLNQMFPDLKVEFFKPDNLETLGISGGYPAVLKEANKLRPTGEQLKISDGFGGGTGTKRKSKRRKSTRRKSTRRKSTRRKKSSKRLSRKRH